MDYSIYNTVKTLKQAAQPRQAYHFDQGQDWWNVRWHGGACDAITIDWIRRRFVGKKNLGAQKYQTGWIWNSNDRSKLGAKHVLLSRLFREEREKSLRNLNAFQRMEGAWARDAYRNFVQRFHQDAARAARKLAKDEAADESGFERMEMSCPGFAGDLLLQPARVEAVKALVRGEGLDPENRPAAWGVMLTLFPQGKNGDGSGHAVGIFRSAAALAFFDPNHGEYDFTGLEDDLVSFVVSLWRANYGTYSFLIPYYFVLR